MIMALDTLLLIEDIAVIKAVFLVQIIFYFMQAVHQESLLRKPSPQVVAAGQRGTNLIMD